MLFLTQLDLARIRFGVYLACICTYVHIWTWVHGSGNVCVTCVVDGIDSGVCLKVKWTKNDWKMSDTMIIKLSITQSCLIPDSTTVERSRHWLRDNDCMLLSHIPRGNILLAITVLNVFEILCSIYLEVGLF